MAFEDEVLGFALGDAPLGKCTAESKISLPEEVDSLLTFLATAHSQTKAAYIRDVLVDHCLGRAAVVRMRVQRPLRSAG